MIQLRPPSWLYAVAAVCLIALAVFVLGRCSQQRALNDARNEATKSDARTISATEAITEIGKLNERGQATDKQTQEAINAVRQADPSERDSVGRARLQCLQQPAACNGVQ